MLTRPERAKAPARQENSPTVAESLSLQGSVWNEREWGIPLNQEDLAYTLLTFGYVIPLALERWGCR